MNQQEEQFKQVYDANFSRIIRLCMGYMGGDQQAAKELTQEVFVKVWENWHRFRGESSMDTWIYRIAINTCLVSLRKKKPFVKNYELEIASNTEEVDVEEDKAQKLKQMYACINSLSETNKAIIMLELEGKPQKEIAEIMGLKHEAVRTRVHRIKDKLTKCIQNDGF